MSVQQIIGGRHERGFLEPFTGHFWLILMVGGGSGGGRILPVAAAFSQTLKALAFLPPPPRKISA